MKIIPILKKAVVLLVSVFILNILQTAVFPYLALGGVIPNLLLVLTSFYGFMRNRREGMIAGLLCGLVIDFSSGTLFGTHVIILLTIGYLNGLSRKVFFGDDVKLPILFVGLSDLLYGLFIYLVSFAFRQSGDFNFYLMNIIIPEAVYSVMISFVLYFIYARIFIWMNREERKVEHIL